MNPAALKANLSDVPRGADIIANTDEFTKRNLSRVGYEASPLEDGSLSNYNLHAVPVTSMTVKALEEFDITRKDAERAKNMFALGLLSWLYNRPVESTIAFLESKFAGKPEIMKANKAAFQAGWNYGETTEAFSVQYEVKPARLHAGHLPQHHRQQRARLRPRGRFPAVRAAAVPRLIPDHAGLATSCTNCPSSSGSGCARSRPRTRSAAWARRSARPSAAHSASPRPPVPGWR